MKIRKPVVAGQFYAGSPDRLKEELAWCYRHDLGPGELPSVNASGPGDLLAVIVPHAGYRYSGPVAAHAYSALARDGVIDTAVIIGPNHSGYGPAVSVWPAGYWETPLGRAEINEEFASNLLGDTIKADETAHLSEHSVEVQLPWLQHLYKGIKIVPIVMKAQDLDTASAVGKAIAAVSGRFIVIASSDFTHYEHCTTATQKDALMIKAITDMDEIELYKQRKLLGCTMCGHGPISAAIIAARERGASSARLLKYATSGETSGDFTSVVGYGSIAIGK